MAITLVTSTPVTAEPGASATLVLTLGAAVAINDTIILSFTFQTGQGITISSVVDSLGGNTYTQRFTYSEAVNTLQEYYIYTCRIATAGTPTITVTFNSAANQVRGMASGWTGMATGNPVDQTGTGTAGSGTAITTGTISPGFDNELIYGYSHFGPGTPTTGAGFTTLITNSQQGTEYKIQTTATPLAVTFTGSGGGTWSVIGATFMAPQAATPPDDGFLIPMAVAGTPSVVGTW